MPNPPTHSDHASNPLLEPGLPGFSRIRPEHALPAIEQRLTKYSERLKAIERGEREPGPDTIADEVGADDALALAWSTVGHLHAVMNTPEWRDVYSACLERISAFYTARGQNRALQQCWQAVADAPDFIDQTSAFRRMVEHELADFHLSGVDLPEPARTRFAETCLRLSKLGNQFGNHVLDATEQWWIDFNRPEALAGLPASELGTLAEKARQAGVSGWRADLSHPCYRAIVTFADDRDLRERVYTAHATRASNQGPQAGRFDNEPIVDEMLRLRGEQAELLGFDSAAAMKLSRRMADDVAAVDAFLHDLAERARPTAAEQLAELTAFAHTNGGPERLEAWDIAYWSEKMREATLGLSQEKLKPWFELERMLSALFALAERLFGITIEHDATIETWHPSVRFYRVQLGDDRSAAGLYLDLYARSGKNGGAWMDVCRQRRCLDGEPQRPPIAYLTCNFATPADGHPSLLTHDDVVTLFHEFGHCLHHLLTEVDWPPVAGISGVEWDAVELPSQLLEGWAWEADFLREHAVNHETGEPLPDELINALDADRKFLGALALTRQLTFARTDLALHRGPVDDPIEVMRRVHAETTVTPLPDFNRFLMSFSHLFDGGYAAGYYSYLWAERLARDAFDLFRTNGLYNAELGERLRAEILAVGGSRPMADSWQAFAGRAPRLEPLLDTYGVAA
ncbi:MAG: M3 family metallopeptidase [Wenzhouxiangellaceae bacterium]|nr:M3 family metallopeptidase [Wenzhouxiangellaceae bacterium]